MSNVVETSYVSILPGLTQVFFRLTHHTIKSFLLSHLISFQLSIYLLNMYLLIHHFAINLKANSYLYLFNYTFMYSFNMQFTHLTI